MSEYSKMKITLQNILPFFLALLLLASCEEENKDSLKGTVFFQTKIGLSDHSGDFVIGDTLRLSTGYDFNLKKFKLYLSHITLSNEAGEQVELEDILLADVGDANTGGFTALVPSANYNRLSLGFGLDEDQNNQLPENFDREHPLSSFNQMYWSMLKYRFAILEGRSDDWGQLNGDGSDILNAYHPGSDSLYREVTYPISLKIEEGRTKAIELWVILDQIFAAGEGIDLRSEPQSHSELGTPSVPGDFYIAKKFMDNLAQSSEIRLP